ncbi:hypothetical protein AAC387_Pa06g0250 [Persea americana]
MSTTAIKRLKQDVEEEEEEELLRGLPDHLAQLCLSRVPPALLYSVCRPWRHLIYSSSFPPFLSIYAILSSSSSSNSSSSSSCIGLFSFDPISATWVPLPPPPPNPPLRLLLLRHPSFISRHLPVQSVSLSGHLLLLAATTHHLVPALSHPLVFHPISKQWRFGPPIPTPRRWCAAGSVGGAVYMASGVGAEYSAAVARRAERWELEKKGWEKVAGMRDGRFSREAVEAVGLRGKLCMVNVKGDAAKEGAVYDVAKDEWEEMPEGMLAGWKGPAAALDERVMYAVLEEEIGIGVLMVYDPDEGDEWREVVRSEHLRGAGQIAAEGGRVCAVCSGGTAIVVVDVVAKPPRIWVLHPPPSKHVVSIHVLPRMSAPIAIATHS